MSKIITSEKGKEIEAAKQRNVAKLTAELHKANLNIPEHSIIALAVLTIVSNISKEDFYALKNIAPSEKIDKEFEQTKLILVEKAHAHFEEATKTMSEEQIKRFQSVMIGFAKGHSLEAELSKSYQLNEAIILEKPKILSKGLGAESSRSMETSSSFPLTYYTDDKGDVEVAAMTGAVVYDNARDQKSRMKSIKPRDGLRYYLVTYTDLPKEIKGKIMEDSHQELQTKDMKILLEIKEGLSEDNKDILFNALSHRERIEREAESARHASGEKLRSSLRAAAKATNASAHTELPNAHVNAVRKRWSPQR